MNVSPDLLTLAEHILKSKEAEFDPSKFVDRYEQAVLQLLEKKQKGLPAPKAPAFVAPTNVINLMDALRRSLATDEKAGAAPKAPAAAPAPTNAAPKAKKPKKRVEGQGEILLPIQGRKGDAKTEPKPASQPAGRRKAG